MKFVCKSRKLVLPLAISMSLSFPSFSAQICSIEDTFDEKLKNFSPNTEVSEINTIEGVNIDEFTNSIKNFETETKGLKFGALEVFNLELSALQLKQGIETKNTREIVNSSVMLASTFVPVMVDAVIEGLALEFDSNPVTAAIGGSIMIGLNIYNGVEEEKSIEQQKENLSNIDKIYLDRAKQLKDALSNYREAITGGDQGLLALDENNVSNFILGGLKKNIDKTIISLSKDVLNRRILKNETTSLLHDSKRWNINPEGSIGSNLDQISRFLTWEYSVADRYIPYEKKLHSLNIANWQYVGMWAEIAPEDMEQALRGGINDVMVSPFKHFLKNYAWLRDVYVPILDKILDEMYVNNDVLYKAMKESIEYQLTNPDFEEHTRSQYNETINTKYAWIKFGSELLENLDLSKERGEEAGIWLARILTPLISPFLESTASKGIFKELNVQSKVATIVGKLIEAKIDIHNKDALYAMIKADEESEDIPSSVMGAITTAYNKTLLDVNSLNIEKDEIKLYDMSDDAVNKILIKLQNDINEGKFNKSVEDALNNYAMEFFIPNDKGELIDKMYAMAEKISAIQAAYNGHVSLAIRTANDKIHVTTDNQEVINILKDLASYLINNFTEFYNGEIPIIMPNTKQNVEFISFGSLPFAHNDLKYILELIYTEIKDRQESIGDINHIDNVIQ